MKFLLFFLIPLCGVVAAESPEASADVQPPAIEAKGLLRPLREVRLASRAKGVISDIKREGTEVKEGEIVMALEDNMERLQVEQQQKVLSMREFEGKAGESLNKMAAISRMEAMEKTVNFEVAKILLAQAQEALDRRKVLAPFHGFVTERLRESGEAVDEFIPVLTMADLSRLYFEAYIPADRVRDVEDGQPAEVRIDTFPEKIFTGRVALKSPVINPASQEFKIKIEIDNSDHLLSSGLPGNCRIIPLKKNLASPESPVVAPTPAK